MNWLSTKIKKSNDVPQYVREKSEFLPREPDMDLFAADWLLTKEGFAMSEIDSVLSGYMGIEKQGRQKVTSALIDLCRKKLKKIRLLCLRNWRNFHHSNSRRVCDETCLSVNYQD